MKAVEVEDCLKMVISEWSLTDEKEFSGQKQLVQKPRGVRVLGLGGA